MLKQTIKKCIDNKLVKYDGSIVKFGEFVIGGVTAHSDDELVEIIYENCLNKEFFGGARFFEQKEEVS